MKNVQIDGIYKKMNTFIRLFVYSFILFTYYLLWIQTISELYELFACLFIKYKIKLI